MITLIRQRKATRSPTLGGAPKPTSLEARGDRDLLPVAIILWLASVARVGYGLWEREVFDAEATLALLCVVLIPWLFRPTLPRRHPLPRLPAQDVRGAGE
jgi:hypothetical protein